MIGDKLAPMGRLIRTRFAIPTLVLAVGLFGCNKKKDDAPKKKAPDKTATKKPITKNTATKKPATKTPPAPTDAKTPPADANTDKKVGIHYIETSDGPCKAVKDSPMKMTAYKVGEDGKRTKIGCMPKSDALPHLFETVVAAKEADGHARAAATVIKQSSKEIPESGGMSETTAVWEIYGPNGKTVAKITTQDKYAGGQIALLTSDRRYVMVQVGTGINLSPFLSHVYDTKANKKVKLGDTGELSLKGNLVVIQPAPNPNNPEAPPTCFDLKTFKKAPAKSCPKE